MFDIRQVEIKPTAYFRSSTSGSQKITLCRRSLPAWGAPCKKLRSSFEETHNFLYVPEGYRLTTEKKLYPQLWVIELLQNRFETYLKANGQKNLDEVFGFSRGRGETTPWEEDALRARNLKLAPLVMKLESMGLTRTQASNAISSLLSRLTDGQVAVIGRLSQNLSRMDLSGKAIKRAVDNVAEELYHIPIMFRNRGWTDDERRQSLSAFFRSELPKKIVQELSLD